MRLPADFLPPTARRRFDVTSADGTRIAVQVHGPDDAPTVVLAHGWTCSAGFWGRVLHRLGGRVRAVAFDQRGHGRSAPVSHGACTTRALADDLAAVLEATVPDGERAVVAGHSMGAMGLLSLAGEHPHVLRDRVAAALLASTGVGRLVDDARVVPAPRRLRRVAKVLTSRSLADGRLLTALPVAGRRVAVSHITLSPAASAAERAYCTDVVASCDHTTRLGFALMLRDLALETHLAALTVPALVLVGSADRLTPPRHSHRMADRLPHSLGVLELPGIGHMTPVQVPDVVVSSILDLVRDHGTTAPGPAATTAQPAGSSATTGTVPA